MSDIRARRNDLDVLKGIAIIGVIMYHAGLLESGYLGVDIFLVLNGFFVLPKMIHSIKESSFAYLSFLRDRLFRFLPLLGIACFFCATIGYFCMLPDDYENLSQSIIASIFFSNNILSGITTKNYWNTVNAYKPLMHSWYLGILMQFYIVIPIVVIGINCIRRKLRKCEHLIEIGMILLSAVSLALFFLPTMSIGNRFYYLPCRLFELLVGGLVGCFYERLKTLKIFSCKKVAICNFILLLTILFIDLFTYDFASVGAIRTTVGEVTQSSTRLLFPNTILVPLTVLFTCFFLVTDNMFLDRKKILVEIGKRSYSLFIWHQIIFAFYRYSVSTQVTVISIVVCGLLTAIMSAISYRFVEQWNVTKQVCMASTVFALVLCILAGYIYFKAGVVRDVPELDITKDNVHRNMHAKYCDRIYEYDKDFSDVDGKTNILIIGNSFARDWGNILLESDVMDKIALSYSFEFSEELVQRIQKTDVLFVFANKNDVPDYVWENIDERCVWAIGTKNFGSNNGNIYAKRFSDDYYDQTIVLDEGYKILNERWKLEWGEQYIDLISPVTDVEGNIRVFTDDYKYISQDTQHLTKAGATYYSGLLDINKFIFE